MYIYMYSIFFRMTTIHIHACMHAYIPTYLPTYIHTYIHTYMHTMYIRTYVFQPYEVPLGINPARVSECFIQHLETPSSIG